MVCEAVQTQAISHTGTEKIPHSSTNGPITCAATLHRVQLIHMHSFLYIKAPQQQLCLLSPTVHIRQLSVPCIVLHACTVSLLGQLAPPAAVMHCQACGDVRVTTTRKCDAVGLLAPLAAGGTAIIPAGGKFSAGTHWRDAVEHKATYYTAVPTMHQVRPLLSKHYI